MATPQSVLWTCWAARQLYHCTHARLSTLLLMLLLLHWSIDSPLSTCNRDKSISSIMAASQRVCWLFRFFSHGDGITSSQRLQTTSTADRFSVEHWTSIATTHEELILQTYLLLRAILKSIAGEFISIGRWSRHQFCHILTNCDGVHQLCQGRCALAVAALPKRKPIYSRNSTYRLGDDASQKAHHHYEG